MYISNEINQLTQDPLQQINWKDFIFSEDNQYKYIQISNFINFNL